jgi:hypothetical protein
MPFLSRWWVQMLGMALLPVAAAFLGYELLALLIPGRVSFEAWRSLLTACLLFGAAGCLVVAWRARASWVARVSLALAVFLPLLLAAFLSQVRSTCPDGPTHIGGSAKKVSSCR